MNDSIDLNAALAGYLECALWSSTGDDGEPLDDSYFETDITEESQKEARVDIECFITDATDAGIDLEPLYKGQPFEGTCWSQMGHDLWLTRNHHGAGFWDRGYGPVGDQLTAIAQSTGSADAYAGDDGRVHIA